MAKRALLVSNNPRYLDAPCANVELRFVDGSALDVLIAARDLAHQGWLPANHPLYGNFTPHQQPYRSLLMLPPDCQGTVQKHLDMFSPLEFLEQAIARYRTAKRVSRPEDVPAHMRQDCAVIDRELMRATLESLH